MESLPRGCLWVVRVKESAVWCVLPGGGRDKLAGNGLPNVKKWCILSLLTVFSAMKKTAGEFKHRYRVSFAGKFYCRQRKSSVEVLSTDSGQVLPEDLSTDSGQVLPESLSIGRQ